MADALPPVPIWFAQVGIAWKACERFPGILSATRRKKQLERLKESHKLELTCRTYGPGIVNLYARLRTEEE